MPNLDIKQIKDTLEDYLIYILQYSEHLDLSYLIEKTELLAKSFNQHHFAFVACKKLKREFFIEMPPEIERYLRKLIRFIVDALYLIDDFINHIDNVREADYINLK